MLFNRCGKLFVNSLAKWCRFALALAIELESLFHKFSIITHNFYESLILFHDVVYHSFL